MRLGKEQGISAKGQILFLTLLGALSQVLGFGYRVALSRMVGAEVMGLYQLLMPVYSVLLSLTAVGLTAAVSNLTSHYLALGNSRGMVQMVRTCIIGLFLLLIPVAAVVLGFSDPISVFFLGDARTQLGLMLLVPCVALTGVENLYKHTFYGAGLVRPPSIVELLEQLVRTVAVLGLLLVFLPQYPERVVGLIVTGMCICEVFSAGILTLLYHRRVRRMGLKGPGECLSARSHRVRSIAIPAGTTALLGNLMGAVNATLIPRRLVEGGVDPETAISEFGVICGMTLPMLALPTVFLGATSLVLIPKLAHWTALGRTDMIQERINRAMSGVSLLILPAMGMMAVLGTDLGAQMFQQEGVGEYLIPLAVVMAMSCYQSTLGAALNGIGQQGAVARISILCDGVQLAFILALVHRPEIGMGGYVLGSLAASLLGLILCAWTVRRQTGLRFQLFSWLTAPGLAALLMALNTNLLFRKLKDEGLPLWGAGAASILFGTVLYLVTLHAQGVSLKGSSILPDGRSARWRRNRKAR